MESLPLPVYRPWLLPGRGLLKVALDTGTSRRVAMISQYYRASKLSVLLDGMAELLAAFERNGILWGVVTNKPAWLTNFAGLEPGVVQPARSAVMKCPRPPAPVHLLACKRID